MADDAKRIEELEARVRELTHLVEELAREHVEKGPEAADESQGLIHTASIAAERARNLLVRDMRQGVDLAVGGPRQAPLESRIGAIWLGRLAMVALMTALVLGAALTSQWQALGEVPKVAIGYGVAAAFIVYGLLSHRSTYLFPKTVLGAGLALVYFTTYAAFFVEAMQLFSNRTYAIPALLACLIAILGIAHQRRSKAATGIALFLVYYTVLLSGITTSSATGTLYALGTSAVLAIAAFIFHLLHRWMFLTWSALLATYAAYGYFFFERPGVAADSLVFFWWSNGFLTLCFLLFSLAFILDARRGLQGAYAVPYLAALNSILYVTLTWSAVESTYPSYDWAYRFGVAALFALMAIAAEWAGARRSRLVHLFAVQALVMLTLALQTVLDGPGLALALAGESLALALLYVGTATPLWKLLSVPLLALVTVAAVYTLKFQGIVALGPYQISSRWVATGVVTGALLLAALLYERFAGPVRARRGGPHSVPGWPSDSRAALLHALAPVFILLLLFILDFGDHPHLPYFLSACALGSVVAALIFRLPQLVLVAVLFALAAHAAFHVFHRLGVLPETSGTDLTLVLPLLLALVTLLLGPPWERYLRRTSAPGLHRDLLAAIPYTVGSFLVVTLAWRHLGMLEQLLGEQGLATLLVLVGVAAGSLPLVVAGTVIFGVTAGQFAHVLVFLPRLMPFEGLAAATAGFFVCLILCERAGAWSARRGRLAYSDVWPFRMAFVTLAVASMLGGIYRAAPTPIITAAWLAAALLLLTVGLVSRAGGYRWGALAVILAAVLRAFMHDITELTPAGRVLSFMMLGIVLLFVSWLYSRTRHNGSGSGKPPHEHRATGGS
jgi:hypothetical protein